MRTFVGIPRIRVIVCWGPYWGPPILANSQVEASMWENAMLSRRFLNLGALVKSAKGHVHVLCLPALLKVKHCA